MQRKIYTVIMTRSVKTGLQCVLMIVLFCFISKTDALECYACSNQDSNVDKCVKTTKQCEEHQDTCLTHIKWGLPPYWIPYGTRQHYVEKDCSTHTVCDDMRRSVMRKCRRDWWDDWECYECCRGDMCNYYVTLGAGKRSSGIWILFGCIVGTFFVIFT